MRAWVGIGGNLGDPVEQVRQAIRELNAAPGITVMQVSSLYRSKPWGETDQPDFANAVVRVETSFGPDELLDALLDVERQLGRTREGTRWGPRIIDLDLLLVVQGELPLEIRQLRLQLPHPRMHERAFVLVPLAELDAGLVIPGQGTVQQCLDRVGPEGVTRLETNLDGSNR